MSVTHSDETITGSSCIHSRANWSTGWEDRLVFRSFKDRQNNSVYRFLSPLWFLQNWLYPRFTFHQIILIRSNIMNLILVVCMLIEIRIFFRFILEFYEIEYNKFQFDYIYFINRSKILLTVFRYLWLDQVCYGSSFKYEWCNNAFRYTDFTVKSCLLLCRRVLRNMVVQFLIFKLQIVVSFDITYKLIEIHQYYGGKPCS